jgi:hypothetical protein
MKFIKIQKTKQINMKSGMKNSILVLFIALLSLLSCTSYRSFYSKGKYVKRKLDCYEFVRYISPYWQIDTFGNNGFRRFISYDIISNCNCAEGDVSWDTMFKYLGKPALVINSVVQNEYYFPLDHDSNNITIGFGSNLVFIVQNSNKRVLATYESYPSNINWKKSFWINNKRVIISPK